jgi:hypothetical protein
MVDANREEAFMVGVLGNFWLLRSVGWVPDQTGMPEIKSRSYAGIADVFGVCV